MLPPAPKSKECNPLPIEYGDSTAFSFPAVKVFNHFTIKYLMKTQYQYRRMFCHVSNGLGKVQTVNKKTG